MPDKPLQQLVREELAELLAIKGPPLFAEIARWPRSMPQYHVGHLQLVDDIEQRVARHPALALAGNAYRGVGVPHCIHSGEMAAEAVIRKLVPPADRSA